MSDLCRGTKKTDGSRCTNKAKDNGYCGVHDPNKKSIKKTDPELIAKALKKLRFRLEERSGIKFQDVDILDEPRTISLAKTDKIIVDYICVTAREFAENDPEKYPLFIREPESTQFSRSVWQRISWGLTITEAYSLALTCKKFYKLFVTDKVHYLMHPFAPMLKSPKIFDTIVYRVLYIEIPAELDIILGQLQKPTPADIYDNYVKMSDKNYALEQEQRQLLGSIKLRCLEELLDSALQAEERIGEIFPGAGYFQYARKEHALEFVGQPPKTMITEVNGCVYVMVQSTYDTRDTVHKELIERLVGFDGTNVIRLSRLQ